VHLLAAALLGVVQGLTEFLPVSSTAHLLVGERLLGFDDPNSVFTEMIQLGSIVAIVWLYRGQRDRFLALVSSSYKALITLEGQAQWDALTDVSPVHDAASETASKAGARQSVLRACC